MFKYFKTLTELSTIAHTLLRVMMAIATLD